MIRTDKAHVVYTDHLTYTTNPRHEKHALYLHNENARGVAGVPPNAGLARTRVFGCLAAKYFNLARRATA